MVINTGRGHLTVIDMASMIYFVVNSIFQTHLTKDECCAMATTPNTYEKHCTALNRTVHRVLNVGQGR